LEFSAEDIAKEVRDVPPGDLLPAIRSRVQTLGRATANEALVACAQVLRSLAKVRGCSEILLAFHPQGDRHRFFRDLFLLFEILPTLTFAADDIKALHMAIPQEVFSDGANGQYLAATAGWAARNPGEGAALIECALGGEAKLRDLVPACLHGLGEAVSSGIFPANDLASLVSRLRQSVPELKAAAIQATPSHIARKLASFDSFLLEIGEAITPDNPEAVTAAAVNAVHLLWRGGTHRPALRAHLRSAARDSRPVVRFAFVSTLSSVWDGGEDLDRDVVRDSLPLLTEISEEHHGIIRDLSWLLYSIAKDDPDIVLSFLRSWALREGETLNVWDSRRFLNLFHELPRELFVRTLVRWLIEDSRLEDTAIHILTTELNVKVIPAIDIQALSATDLRILILALSALDHSSHAAAVLVSLVSSVDLRPDAEDFSSELERALAHAVTNFPSLATTLPGDSELAHGSFKAAAQRLKTHIQAVGELRVRASKMKELACPPERLQLYRRIEGESTGRAMREALKEDPGRTPFYSMAKKVVMLAGGHFFSRHSGRFSPPTPLRRFSTTVELPQLAILDPASQSVRREQIRKSLKTLRRREPA
jgi:hypothetical protein